MAGVYNNIFLQTIQRTGARRHHLLAIFLFSTIITSCDEPSITYPERKDIIETVYASGKIVPVDEHWLSAQSKGLIVDKLVEAGDTIERGQILYII
jgi:HlyD family secretion protein